MEEELAERRRDLVKAERRTQFITSFVGMLTVGLGFVIWEVIDGIAVDLDSLDSGMVEVSRRVAVVDAHVSAHEKEKDIWVNRILNNALAIDDLQTSANSRFDSFTGTQGRLMERRIDVLEKDVGVLMERCNSLKDMCR